MKVLSTVVLALVAAGCTTEAQQISLPELSEASSRGAVEVQTFTVSEAQQAGGIQVTGTTHATKEADLRPEITGLVKAIKVEEGDLVEEGQQLLVLDIAVAKLEAAQARAQAESANVQAHKALSEHDRLAPLAEEGTIAKGRLNELRAQRDGARAAAKAAEAAARASERLLKHGSLRAPFAGTVSRIMVDEGEVAMSGAVGDPVVRLLDLSYLVIRVLVHESHLWNIQLGDRATVEFDGPTGQYEGTVRRISPEIESETRTGEVLVSVANPDGLLRAGMFASVAIHTKTDTPRIVIPRSAVVDEASGTSVFKVIDGRAKKSAVTVRTRDTERAEIASGVDYGDVLVTTAIKRLEDGAEVHSVQAPGAPTAVAP